MPALLYWRFNPKEHKPMSTFQGIPQKVRAKLEFEVVPNDARLALTRLLRRATSSSDQDLVTARQNAIVNIVRNVQNLSLYVLEPDQMGEYSVADHAWHRGEIEVAFRRPSTLQCAEILGDLLEQNWLRVSEVNEILRESNVSFSFQEDTYRETIAVEVLAIDEIPAEAGDDSPNVRLLVERMERSLAAGDYPGVLHASASVFETVAKHVVGVPHLESASLGGFFDRYAKDSNLPDPILGFIRETFSRRNIEPLAGHGHVAAPSITEQEAIVLAHLTKAIVRAERQLAAGSVPHT